MTHVNRGGKLHVTDLQVQCPALRQLYKREELLILTLPWYKYRKYKRNTDI